MAQLRTKRSTGSTPPSSSALANAELAFTEGNEILFIGKGTSGSNAASVVKVGGVGAFCDLETAQTIGGAKTFSSNVIVSGNLTVNGTTTSGVPSNQRLVGTDAHLKYVASLVPGSSWGIQFINKYKVRKKS